jgi:hypothetical protein
LTSQQDAKILDYTRMKRGTIFKGLTPESREIEIRGTLANINFNHGDC